MDATATFERLRPRLIGVAYGLLGSVSDAEDVVQEAWLRLERTDTEAIEDLTGWLVVTTSRLALDVLRSARSRRETYVGPWLPEPVETGADPADSVSLDESVSWAMLVVLEALSPAERAAFVLHDVFGLSFDEVGAAVGRAPAACRKLASRARAHLQARQPRFDVDPQAHREVVAAFANATTSGDLVALMRLLDPDAVLTSDGGGVVHAAPIPIRGAVEIARFFAGLDIAGLELTTRASVVNGTPALLIFERGRISTVLVLGIHAGRIATIDAVRNPKKFHGLHRDGAGN